MAGDSNFSERLRLVLKALSISGGRLAADVGVDKSLVSRWCSGSVVPGAHNLARLTQAIAVRHPGFTMLDWELDLSALAARFGVSVPSAAAAPDAMPSAFAEWLALPKLQDAAQAAAGLHGALAGIWRTTRPSPEYRGKFAHDHAILEPTPDGTLRFRTGVFSARLIGWSVSVGEQLYSAASDPLTGASIFSIFNYVRRPRIDRMDGITLSCMSNAGGTPVANACLLERIGDLSGDPAADNARYEALLAEHPIAPDGSIPEAIRNHLLFDCGPAAMAAGGDHVLMMRAMNSLARG
ncbi:MAG: helix-turn-helix transcriptional regulator [Pseudomonadota bacterium]